MKGKGLKGILGVTLVVLVFGLSACNPSPPFFTHTDADAPAWTGTSNFTSGEGVFPRVFWPGTLNLGAQKTDQDFCVYMTMNSYTPYIWDHDSSVYRDISTYDGDSLGILFGQVVDITPAPSGSVTWTLHDATSSVPSFCAQASSFFDFSARTVMEVKINELDGANYTFRGINGGTTRYMTSSRVFYVRTAGSGSETFHIVDVNFSTGDSVATNWNPQVTMNAEFGQFIGAMGATIEGDTLDVIPIVPCSSAVSGGDITYTLCKSREFIAGKKYYLVLAQTFTSNWGLGMAKVGSPLSQDLDANVIAGDSSGEFTLGDLKGALGGSTVGVDAYYTYVLPPSP